MPGIVGIVDNSVEKKELLQKMCDSIKHKEWHKIDKYINGKFCMGRIHLGIINPEPQPIFNEKGNLCIFMDGEV